MRRTLVAASSLIEFKVDYFFQQADAGRSRVSRWKDAAGNGQGEIDDLGFALAKICVALFTKVFKWLRAISERAR